MKCIVDGKQLKLPGGKAISFEYPIREIAEFDGVIVVVLSVPAGCFLTENVYGVSWDGDIIWQIERIEETSKDKGNYYVGISAICGDKIRLANWNDTVVEVDVRSGRVIGSQEGRFT